jgi:hypothetical protein
MLTKLFSNNSLASSTASLMLILTFGSLMAWEMHDLAWELGELRWEPHPLVAFTLLLLPFAFSCLFFDVQQSRSRLFKQQKFNGVGLASIGALFLLAIGDPIKVIYFAILCFFFGRAIQLSRSSKPDWLLTDLGFFIGIGFSLHSHFLLLLPLCWLVSITTGTLTLRNFFAPIIGTGLSFWLISMVIYLINGSFFFPVFHWQFTDLNLLQELNVPIWVFVPLVMGALTFLLFGLGSLNRGIVARRQMIGFLLGSFILIGLLSLGIRNATTTLLFLAFPMAMLYSNYLQIVKTWWLKDLVLISPMVSLILLLLF